MPGESIRCSVCDHEVAYGSVRDGEILCKPCEDQEIELDVEEFVEEFEDNVDEDPLEALMDKYSHILDQLREMLTANWCVIYSEDDGEFQIETFFTKKDCMEWLNEDISESIEGAMIPRFVWNILCKGEIIVSYERWSSHSLRCRYTLTKVS